MDGSGRSCRRRGQGHPKGDLSFGRWWTWRRARPDQANQTTVHELHRQDLLIAAEYLSYVSSSSAVMLAGYGSFSFHEPRTTLVSEVLPGKGSSMSGNCYPSTFSLCISVSPLFLSSLPPFSLSGSETTSLRCSSPTRPGRPVHTRTPMNSRMPLPKGLDFAVVPV